MSQIAASFLRRCFAPEETIAVLLRGENDAAPMQRVVRLEQALETRYMAWLSYENQHGRNNVYVAANPLRSGSRRRTKESIAAVRHLYIDIDFGRSPCRCAPRLRCCASTNSDRLHFARQISGALARGGIWR